VPMLSLQCAEGHQADQFVHTLADVGAATRLCPQCGHTLAPTLSVGRGLTFFEEGRPFVMTHGVPHPIRITSHEQHKKVMKRYGLEPAYRWVQGPLGR
jgi:hypothetical protein